MVLFRRLLGGFWLTHPALTRGHQRFTRLVAAGHRKVDFKGGCVDHGVEKIN